VDLLMPLSMPMWPPVFTAMTTRTQPVPTASPTPLRRRWMIVDDNVRREVDEAEYRDALASCDRIEVAHYPHEDVVTHLCYRTPS
jgi:hypothetical protein